jgi:hypothetical protein
MKMQKFSYPPVIRFSLVILREPFALCHSEGAERLKNLTQGKLREESVVFLCRFFDRLRITVMKGSG